MGSFKYWLEIARDLLAVIGIGVALYRVIIMKNTFFSDHERNRKTKAVDLVQFWNSILSKQSIATRKLVESFSEEQCKSLADQKKLTLDANKKDLVKEVVSNIKIDKKNGLIKLDKVQSNALRWETINYLNQLETLLAAWRHDVVDKEILEEALRGLYNPRKNQTVMEKFRTMLGEDQYPGIREFTEHVKSQLEKGDNH